jgi:glycosyltransferase involved in cell wall biosynthesis
MAGTERRFFEIGKRLVERGHEVHVLTIRYDNNLPKEEMIEGMFVHRYAYSKNYVLPKTSRSLEGVIKYSLLTFVKLFGKHFDICYSNEWPIFHSLFAKPAVPCLVQEWCEVWTNPGKVTVLQKILTRFGDHHVAVSQFTEKRLINLLKLDPEKVTVIPNGVDYPNFRNDLGNKVRGRIVYVGRLVPHKRVDLLIEAFQKVKENVPEAELHIVGTGPLLSSIKEKSSTIRDCFVHGFLSEEDLRDLLKTSWVFVLPSEREGSSIVALEAMAAGIPVITVDFPNNAAKELAQFSCCLVTKPNSKSIASAVLRLWGDEELWSNIRQNALEFAEKNNWDTVSIQIEECMRKMVCDAQHA